MKVFLRRLADRDARASSIHSVTGADMHRWSFASSTKRADLRQAWATSEGRAFIREVEGPLREYLAWRYERRRLRPTQGDVKRLVEDVLLEQLDAFKDPTLNFHRLARLIVDIYGE
jgi:hypothetical protein